MAELNPIKRVVSKLDGKLTYDKVFDDNSLLVHDKDHESSLHHINIFGKQYLICMGKMYRHEENEDIGYCIVYLMYDDKVVSRLGVYEMYVKDVKDENNIDFSSLDLIIKEEYYIYQEPLELYSIDDKKLQEIISSTEEKEDSEEKEEVKEDGEEKEDGEINTNEEEEEIFDGEDNIHKVFYEITKGGDYINLSNKKFKNIITPAAIYYYIKELEKYKTEEQNKEIKYLYKIVFPTEKSGKGKIVTSKIHILVENKTLNYSMMLLNILEYILNIKFITMFEYKDEDKEDEYGDFSLYENKEMKLNFDESKHKKTSTMYNNYKPTKFMFIKITDGENSDKQYSVYTLKGKHITEYNDLEEEMKETIKGLYEYSGNEYSKESNTHFKQLFNIVQ